MSTLIVLNNTAPGITPSGCDGGLGTVATPADIQMSIGGAAGSTPISGSGVGLASITFTYYIGVTGQYNGMTISAGTWTIPLHLASASHPLTLNSIFIYRTNSSGVAQATIGSSTGLSTALSVGTQSFNVTGSSATFSSGDIVVISFQVQAGFSGTTFSVTPDQTVTAPSNTVAASVLIPAPLVVRRDFRRSAKIYSTRLPLMAGVGARLVPAPRVFRRDYRRRGFVAYERPPLKAPAITSVKIQTPFIRRSDYRRGALVYRTRVYYPKAFRVLRPLVVLRDTRRERQVYLSRKFLVPLLPVTTGPVSGARILFKRGPLADIPTGNSGEPLWTTDSHQLFMGDGFGNHKMVSMESAPVTSSSPGYPGQVATDGTYLYVCISANSWKRITLTVF